jgi:dienelactone hydrolase
MSLMDNTSGNENGDLEFADMGDGRKVRIEYSSRNVFEIHHILCKMEHAPEQSVVGHLFLPEQTTVQPVPCVIACHGSRGWREHNDEHIKNWLAAGIAVFKVYSFESRQVDNVVEDQMMVTHAMMLADAFSALKLLGNNPQIDAARIAISGWSLGGMVALYAAWLPLAEALAPDGERFCAHLPFYPAAYIRTEEERWSGAPIQILHGEIDDYTPLILATGLAAELKPLGVDIEIKVYPDAHHSFDSNEPITWHENAIRLDERTVYVDLEGNMTGEVMPGVRISLNEPADRMAAFQHTKLIGAHYGGNEAARNQSRIDAVEFLTTVLDAGQ